MRSLRDRARRSAHWIIAPAAVLSWSACSQAPVHIAIDLEDRHQTMVGWEATATLAEFGLPDPLRDSLVALAVDVIGVNRLRVPVRSGSETPTNQFGLFMGGELDQEGWRCVRYATINDNPDPYEIDWDGFDFSELDLVVETVVIPAVRRLEERGERMYLNLNYTAFTRQICGNLPYIHSEQPEEYAEFVLATFIHLRDRYGLAPDALEIILEPNLTGTWTGQQVGHALVAAEARLSHAGFHPEFIAPSGSNVAAALDYFEDLETVPGAAQLVSEVSYHRYSPVTSAGDIRQLADHARLYGARTSMLEKIDAGVAELHEDLTIGGVSAWQQFVLAFPTRDNGAQLIVYGEDGTITIAAKARELAQYFRYVRSGAVRVGASSSSSRVRTVAFESPDGSVTGIVQSSRRQRFVVTGLPPGRYRTTYTTQDAFFADEGTRTMSAGDTLFVAIPDQGVLSIVTDRDP